MPLFSYKALRENGISFTGDAMAASTEELRQSLENKGYLVLHLEKKRVWFKRIGGSSKDFLLFNQEFATLIKAGLPILQSLEILYKRTEKQSFRAVLENVILEIKRGNTLSDAMALHPAFFSPLYTSNVRAGEKSGALVDVLRRFIAYQKKMLAVRRKLIMALAYPAFLVIALIAVLTLFFLYIIPNFAQMYSDQTGSLPFLTALLVSFTAALVSYAPFIFIGIIAVGGGVFLWQKMDSGRRLFDSLRLRIPIFKSLIVQYILAQITRTLATVLRGGIPLVQALDATSGVISNSVMAQKLSESRKLVIEGVSLADAFDRTRIASEMTVRMIEVGESSGELPQMLEDVADFYDQELENRLTVLTTMVEPVLMLSMGLVIAVIVVALYLPIFEMGSRLK